MNNKVYNELIEAQKLLQKSHNWKEYTYEEYIANDYQLLRQFIQESTLETYAIIWRKTAREYIINRNKENFKYIYPELDGVLMIYYYNYTGIRDNLRKALEEYQNQKNVNLRAHFMTNSYVTSIYDVELLLQMFTLDGFTYKFVSKELNNNVIRLRISKEEVEKHLQKAQEHNIWMNRDEESYSQRVLLLNNLQK